jgi:hemerythrin
MPDFQMRPPWNCCAPGWTFAVPRDMVRPCKEGVGVRKNEFRRLQMIVLTKDMEVGVAKIDAQHKELINRLNAVVSMGAKSVTKEETQKTLNLLGEYIVKHFSDEEALQKQSGYPKHEWHKGQHQLYIGEFEKLKKEFNANGISAKFTLDLSNSIINWIVKHIKTVDVDFGKHYRQQT